MPQAKKVYPTSPHVGSIWTPTHTLPDVVHCSHHLLLHSDLLKLVCAISGVFSTMSFALLPSAMRAPAAASLRSAGCPRRNFHLSSARASILFALSSLSNSRETQHFNKLSNLSRVEHSPPLKLIKTSEVDTYPCPTPSTPTPPSAAWQTRSSTRSSAITTRIWDNKALSVGRVLLADQARQTHRLHRALERAQRKEAKRDALMRRDKVAWQAERQKLRNEMRAAGMWILLSIGTATALATWRFWPQTEYGPDSADLGRKIAARASAAMPLPPAVSREPTMPAPLVIATEASQPAMDKVAVLIQRPLVALQPESVNSWWKNLFWKQQ